VLREGQLIWELKLEGVNHNKRRTQVKTVYMPEGTCNRETFLSQEETDTTSKIQPIPREAYF
jgi:hypothetical protein